VIEPRHCKSIYDLSIFLINSPALLGVSKLFMLTRNRVLMPNFPIQLNYDYDRASVLWRVSAESDDTVLKLNALNICPPRMRLEGHHRPTMGNTIVMVVVPVTRERESWI